MTVRFDAYTATTVEANYYQLTELLQQAGGAPAKQSRGFHHFANRVEFKDGSDQSIGAVQWGGAMSPRSMIEVKGESSPGVVEGLRRLCNHRVTRMDSCADFDAPGSFDRLLVACMAVKRNHRLKGSRAGDWQDFPELGRTQYLGSPQSTTMLRLYEKGKQLEYAHLDRPDWVRAEIQVRPAKVAKSHCSTWSAADAWGASNWSTELAGEILADHVDPHPAGTTWRRPDRERALRWMCKQYGSHLLSLVEDCGTWENVGLTLSEIIKEQRVSQAK